MLLEVQRDTGVNMLSPGLIEGEMADARFVLELLEGTK
jgi:hypothetical protein